MKTQRKAERDALDYMTVEFEVSAERAMFSDPVIRNGGERASYPVPTYSALVGICESIYWKPTFIWVIDSVRICNEIQTETEAMLMPKLGATEPGENGGGDRCYCNYLADVRYQVRAHMEWDKTHPELAKDRNPAKHHGIAIRSVKIGGRCPVYMGKKEGLCFAEVTPCSFGEGAGFYDNVEEKVFSNMLHSIIYPNPVTKQERSVCFWDPVMERGVIKFPRPENCERRRFIPQKKGQPLNRSHKTYIGGRNFTPVEKEYGEETK